MIYIASPYSHLEEEFRELRFWQVCSVAGNLMRAGHVVFSPIAHSHSVADLCELPTDWEFWQNQCIEMLRLSEKVVVAMMPGWQESRGVTAEIAIAKELGIPVEYLEVSL